MPSADVNCFAKPFRVTPRLDCKPWGGKRLAHYGYELTAGGDEPLGEVLLTANEAVIADGPLVGRSLGDVMSEAPEGLAGHLGLRATGDRPLFPLLIKLIDASQNLSIQVHPDDALAVPLNSLGKTEAWHVLEADPDSLLYLGLQNGANIESFISDCSIGDGRAAHYLNARAAVANQTLMIPAGTVHALGAGVVIYEVQQPSGLTFRLDDWGRVGADGRPRERHLDEGRAAMKPDFRPLPLQPIRLPSDVGERHILTACHYFALERIQLDSGQAAPIATGGSAHVVTVISGRASFATPQGETHLTRGQTGVLAATSEAGTLTATERTFALHAWVPDLTVDIISPLRRAGATDSQIAALSGPLADLSELLSSVR